MTSARILITHNDNSAAAHWEDACKALDRRWRPGLRREGH